MLKCVKCGNQLTIGASDCPRCGYVIGSDRPLPSSPTSIVVLTLGCAVLFNALFPVGRFLTDDVIQLSWLRNLNIGALFVVRDTVATAVAVLVVAAVLSSARVKHRLPYPVPGQTLVIAGLALVVAASLRSYLNFLDDSFARALVGALNSVGAFPLWAGRLLILVGVVMAAAAAKARGASGITQEAQGH